MKTQEIVRQHTLLVSLFNKTSVMTAGDLESQAHWAKYLCVLVAGFLENAVYEIFSVYCNSCSNACVARFAGLTLSKVKNPKTDKFLQIMDNFNSQWSSQLKLFVEDNGRKDAIDAIMTNRHLIAHGKSSNISLTRVKDYLKKSVEVLDFIEQQCGIN